MTFRTDGDALIRRAEALEQENERLEEQLNVANDARESDAKELKKLASQLKEVRRERDKLAAAAGKRRREEPHVPGDQKSRRRAVLVVLGGLVVLLIFIMLWVMWIGRPR